MCSHLITLNCQIQYKTDARKQVLQAFFTPLMCWPDSLNVISYLYYLDSLIEAFFTSRILGFLSLSHHFLLRWLSSVGYCHCSISMINE